jgi:hypothetical protein
MSEATDVPCVFARKSREEIAREPTVLSFDRDFGF